MLEDPGRGCHGFGTRVHCLESRFGGIYQLPSDFNTIRSKPAALQNNFTVASSIIFIYASLKQSKYQSAFAIGYSNQDYVDYTSDTSEL